MSLFPLKVVLLLAVATSQIFGGIACCCLGRSILADSLTVNSVTSTKLASPNELSSVPQKRQMGKCPKCSSRKNSPEAALQTSSNQRYDHRARVCEGGKCQCVKLVVSVNTPSDLPTPNYDSYAWVDPVLDVKPEHEVLSRNSAKYEVPVRFGGCSWQSIACLWKN